MRTRKEIEKEARENSKTAGAEYPHGMAILETLLDIRELLEPISLNALADQLKIATDSYTPVSQGLAGDMDNEVPESVYKDTAPVSEKDSVEGGTI